MTYAEDDGPIGRAQRGVTATGGPPGEGREAPSPVVAKVAGVRIAVWCRDAASSLGEPRGGQPPVSEVAMSQGKDFVVTEYAKALVQAKARQLYHRRGFSPGEQRDIEQELWLVVLEKAQRFDPARPQLETFLDCVVSRGAAFHWQPVRRT